MPFDEEWRKFFEKVLTAGFASGQSGCVPIKRSQDTPEPAASSLP